MSFSIPDAPPGFEYLPIARTTSLLLPYAAVLAGREFIARRDAAAEAAAREKEKQRSEEHRRRMLEEMAAQASAGKDKSDADDDDEALARQLETPPETGWYRVLPGLAKLAKELDSEAGNLRSADIDVNKRREKLVKILVSKGPDRRVASAVNWRERVDKLEATLPQFAGPIASLRQTLALAEVTGRPTRIAPMLLLGPPGVGKTYFSQQVAELLGASHASIGFDGARTSNALSGSDPVWSNSRTGLLFNLICTGDCANPVVLLDEVDKAHVVSSGEANPVVQLHSALEPQTSRRMMDISAEVEFDASMTTYIGTANTKRGIDSSILSRFEVFVIEPCSPAESVETARAIAAATLERLGLQERMTFERKAVLTLAHFSPRLMVRSAEKAVAVAAVDGREEVREDDVWSAVSTGRNASNVH